MSVRSHPDIMRLLVLRLLVLATAVGAVFLLLASTGVADEPPAATVPYVVEAGDSLWSIASRVAPDGGDLRETIEEIADLSGLAGATIHPGQVLRLPDR